MASSLIESVVVHQISPNVYETAHNPDRMANSAPIAYGGCTVAAAIQAAHQVLPSNFHMYSALGNFLGPALTDRKLQCTVRELRRTRAFITKTVEVSQKQNDGKSRMCLFVNVDFHAAEPATLLAFSKQPAMTYTGPEETHDVTEVRAALYASGELSQQMAQAAFGLLERYWDQKAPKEGTNAQNHALLAKTRSTTQDHFDLVDKTTALWLKVKHKIESPTEHCVALSWIQDAGLSFVPLTHSHMWLDDAAACSTLEFALRVFSNSFDLNEWHLRESQTITGGDGRSYSEGRLWDKNGKMISSCTQQCILRPFATKSAKI